MTVARRREKQERQGKKRSDTVKVLFSILSDDPPLSPTFTDSLLLTVILMQEKEQKHEEIKRLKNLKRKEIMEKLEKLKGQ